MQYPEGSTRHPLDPLGANEVRAAVDALRRERGVDASHRFASIALREPAKAVLAAWREGLDLPRLAEAVVWSRRDGATHVATVDLDAGSVVSFEPRPGVQPNFTVDEWHECDEMLRGHPRRAWRRWRAAGSPTPSSCWSTPGPTARTLVPERHRGRRVGWTDVWLRRRAGRQPLCAPRRGTALRRRPQHAWSCSRSRTAGGRRAARR